MDGDQRREIEAEIRVIERALEQDYGFEDDIGPDGLTDNTAARRAALAARLTLLREWLARLAPPPDDP